MHVRPPQLLNVGLVQALAASAWAFGCELLWVVINTYWHGMWCTCRSGIWLHYWALLNEMAWTRLTPAACRTQLLTWMLAIDNQCIEKYKNLPVGGKMVHSYQQCHPNSSTSLLQSLWGHVWGRQLCVIRRWVCTNIYIEGIFGSSGTAAICARWSSVHWWSFHFVGAQDKSPS